MPSPDTSSARPRRQKRTYKPAEERKQEILDCALGLFAEKGYHVTSIGDVCERAGIGRATLYQYFTDKRDLLRALAERITSRVTSAMENRRPLEIPPGFRFTPDQLSHFAEVRLGRVLEIVFENADIARLVLRAGRGADGVVDEMLQKLDRVLLARLQEELRVAIEAGVIRPVDTEFTARFFLGGCEKVLMSYIEAGQPLDARRVAREVAQLEVFGIVAREGELEAEKT
jgi:AcrR family transcriptional regulator